MQLFNLNLLLYGPIVSRCFSFSLQFLNVPKKMLIFFCKKLRPKPRSPDASSSWIIQRHFDRSSPPAGHFFSAESKNGDGNELPCSPKNPKTSDGAQDKVELTKTLLREYGFTNTHLSKLHSQVPGVFTSVPERTLLPKLEFFRGIGFSNADLPKFICWNPCVLKSSLQNQIVPCFNFIKALLLSDSDEDAVKTFKRFPRLISYRVENRIAPKIAALREAGVLQSGISDLLRCSPQALGFPLGESIRKATEMGFDPNKRTFVDAIRVFTGMSKSTWDKKMQVYRRCGMSDEEILMAFMSFPLCMALAEQNIVQTMDFVVKKMGWQPVEVARNPSLLGLSLEKRIIPRCRIVRYLQGKGLLGRSISLSTFLKKMNEKEFLDKYVNRYENDIPELMDVYLGKISPQEPILRSTDRGVMEK